VGQGGNPSFGVDAALRPEDAGRIALEQLAAGGLRRIAYAGPSNDFFSQNRLRGVLEASKKLRLPDPLVWHVPDSIQGGRAAADQWLALPAARRPRGVIGFADPVAVGFLHRLVVKGFRIPQDVAVTGVDDSLVAGAAAIPLSTVRAPVESIGRNAVEAITQPKGLTKNADLRPAWEWVKRESTQ
jgi:LacI family transcriptional regulator